jgi:hypothetical protein
MAMPGTADACSCQLLSWQDRLAASDVVIVARVTRAQPLVYVDLEVRETIKGRPDRQVRIATGQSDCDYFLPPVVIKVGDEFLLYATARDGKLVVNRCLGSGPLDQKADEVARLRRVR